MPDIDPRSEALDRAVQILVNADQEIAYRDLVAKLSTNFPHLSRSELSDVIAELVNERAEHVWRPRPGFFSVRPANIPPRTRRASTRSNPAPEKKWTARPLPNRIENLLRIGFIEIGEWQLSGQDVVPVYKQQGDLTNALIAYSLAESVVYIARESKQKGGPSGKIIRAIRTAIAAHRPVRIFALNEWDSVEHQGIAINIAAGLEEELIERMQPPWN